MIFKMRLKLQRNKNEGLESLMLLYVFKYLLSVNLVEEENLLSCLLHDMQHL
jgi:hypothetical protein